MAKYSIVKEDGKWYLTRASFGFRPDNESLECDSHAQAVAEMVRMDSIQGSSHLTSSERASNWNDEGFQAGWGW